MTCKREREQPFGSPSDAFFAFPLDAHTLFRDFDYFAPEGETRPEVRERVRRCAVRARIGETAESARDAARTTDNTAG